jgi:hypothetical protein
MLPAAFTPAGFNMLTDGSGFSFVDQGLVRIKKFAKRSPKTIELCEPIYGITQVEWLDAATFYVSAKERERFGIFQISVEGTVERLVSNRHADVRYPQKVDDSLFFIEQRDDAYRLMSVDYPAVRSLDVAVTAISSFEERVQLVQAQQKMAQSLLDSEHAQLLFNFGRQPIIFLRMKSPTEGFCVGYPPQIHMDETILACTYFKISLFDAEGTKKWRVNPLFVFNIPVELLRSGSPCRLYESILPLLPRHLGHHIYFVSQDKKGDVPTLDVFCFDSLTNTITKKTCAAPGQYFFAPFLMHGYIYYGFSTFEQNMALEQIKMPRL